MKDNGRRGMQETIVQVYARTSAYIALNPQYARRIRFSVEQNTPKNTQIAHPMKYASQLAAVVVQP
jgi:hypothetical protein